MNHFDEVLKGIKRVIHNRSSYQVAKALDVPNRTINRYQNGTTPIDNMTIGTAEKIYNYYEEMIRMEMETLDQAIKDFNDWRGPAMIYYNKEKGYFNTEVFHSDIGKAQTILSPKCVGIFSRSERETFQIGETRREYMLEFVALLQDGWESDQAERQLMKKYPNIYGI